MKWLSNEVLQRLRAAAARPDVSGTRYRLLEGLGRGGMGVVWLAEDAQLGRRVALKVLDLTEESSELEARLLREARILAQLEHPGIVPVHDVGILSDGRVFYAMKYVLGRRLDQYLTKIPGLFDRLRIFHRICEAVAFAHGPGTERSWARRATWRRSRREEGQISWTSGPTSMRWERSCGS